MNGARREFTGHDVGFLAGGGDLGLRIREFDWTSTCLGAPSTWPQNLRMALRIMLISRQPMWIGWGPDLIYFYNDPYKSIIGGKHPWALGRRTSEVWREIWSDIGPMLDTAMRGDQGTYVESQLLIMERNGYPEETYYTFSYSPIPNDDGSVGGIICANSDDTRRVIGERQLALLRDLATSTAHAPTGPEICRRAATQLAADGQDLPFALIYLPDGDGSTLRLAAVSGADPRDCTSMLQVGSLDDDPWDVGAALASPTLCVVADLQRKFKGQIPRGPWSRAADKAVILPIGEGGRSGVLIVGLNPFRLLDSGYQSFLKLVVGQIAAAIANAQAYEEERRRTESLAEVDRAKTRFFSNISHEFRTPLTLMLGPIEDALSDRANRLPEPQYQRVQLAHRNSLRLLRLVNTLLDFSRIEAGRVEPQFVPVDLSIFTAELASTFQSAIERAGLTLTIACPVLPRPVHADPDMWEKIVLNLLSNALKFTFEGEVCVEVRAAEDGRHAELIVRDTGVGIPQHELPKLFERFHRVEGQRSRSFEGSGIGLALVQELVKLQGGTITIESDEGRGSTFRVFLPFTARTDEPTEPVTSRASPTTRAEAYIEEAFRWLPESTATVEDFPTKGAN